MAKAKKKVPMFGKKADMKEDAKSMKTAMKKMSKSKKAC
jgi:hypothetical protein